MKLAVDPYLETLEQKDYGVYLKVLNEMVNHREIHSALAQHSKTPTEILQKIANQYESDEIPYQVIANPNCPRQILDLVFRQIPDSEPIRTSDPDEQLELFMSSILDDPSISLASNESLTRADLAKLITIPKIADTLASRTNFPADFFIYLWENYLVDKIDPLAGINLPLLKALAQNPMTPVKILKNLSKYEILNSPNEVESLLMSNPALPDAEKAQYALLGIAPTRNRFLENFNWYSPYPSDLAFQIEDFPENLLFTLAEAGHPSGLLKTDYIPTSIDDVDSWAALNSWIADTSIFKTLWPGLRNRQAEPPVSFTYRTGNVVFDATFILYAAMWTPFGDADADWNLIEGGLPDWFISYPNVEEAIWNFQNRDFDSVVEFDLEYAQAWALATADSEYISLTKLADEFITDQDDSDEYSAEDKFRTAEIIDSKLHGYGWDKLKDNKKEFLIQLIKKVFVERNPHLEKSAEHLLTCIYLHPDTPKSLIEKHLSDIDSRTLNHAKLLNR
jgi:hypothetical protein